MLDRLEEDLSQLMCIPGLAGHEDRVRRHIAAQLARDGITGETDRLGNFTVTFPGDPAAPSVMVFAHMDQLGFIVRRIEPDGLLRVERMGGVAERAMAAQAVLVCVGEGRDVPGVILNKAHHATTPEEKYRVVKAPEIVIDTGHGSRAAVEAAGIRIGAPVIYLPQVLPLADTRLAGTAIDDRAGCAVLMALARALRNREGGPTVHIVFSVLEEFNLRGAQVAAQRLKPDVAIQIDLMLATDTPDMADRGEMVLGGGPGMSLYSFHGRGTLNGVIPHPAAVRLIEEAAAGEGLPLQRSAQVGVLTDLSYVQLVGEGVISIDVGFPMRASHSALEVCDLRDLESLARLLQAAVQRLDAQFDLGRDPADAPAAPVAAEPPAPEMPAEDPLVLPPGSSTEENQP
ncbi:M20/M25/M40 family metallo-hydrolase [Ponticoccus sp. SC2-23]|uniref:M42 family metallopeptidase n=1 Tax=Alexandriicola marinus TaxID=2081710 RepID=UPI000FD93DD2|nr:M20/M25/M40 family metallo-hydrolase [Alexandriicola marinus]MBM1220873.1 M20/M25/M40 family metallo-hydrolase [Ponticoccus sp. SC6-9]MBM1225443.1 M20/M25/M40 family metallo-hydrolase [Ponticoccus sp. SC6-15]MBM1227626.1 M20/M25/M40 family metallo-hydrolase [Ponticoccus sp. SC6-38]MBM1234736.1 M20/M25/M40 family metallo-hydrolase [Ponticoccus sp. SC6-45]MBM1238128.1 M20/M25/M40 family metallo-hydrolase [Ponticoccus sp. SC6-49]MBM1244239.1 M20/M25/M40 family metallo-hydrolase [Ponticoccus s